AAARRGIPVTLHTPSEVKAAVTGSGRAGKAQVQQMVARILGLVDLPRPADAADALALGICHLWRPGAVQPGAVQPGPGHPAAHPAPAPVGTDAAGAGAGTAAQRAWAAAEASARRAGAAAR